MIWTPIREFLRLETTAGALLVATAAIAIAAANSPLADCYVKMLQLEFGIALGPLVLDKTVLHWINDGLMAVFFLLVGLEIKREVLAGELSSPRVAALPLAAAAGGMVVPAAVYLLTTGAEPATLAGWPVPTATDIAFALGVLALLGQRVPVTLRVFLLALAIVDDLGAIVLIALLFTADLALGALAAGLACLAGLAVLNALGVRRLWPYLALGALMWLAVLKSGVHATLAGALLGLAIPLRGGAAQEVAPLERLERGLHGWVAFLILPLFAFANAGVSLSGVGPQALTEGVGLGVAAGLVVGKPLGVLLACAIAVATGLARLPADVRWSQLAGVALLTGIGFTMSLFIGTLAFPDGSQDVAIRLGVLGGSLVSAGAGYLWLRWIVPARAT